jgi:tRNA uridine 5-carbamoylmethylation protein Kti12
MLYYYDPELENQYLNEAERAKYIKDVIAEVVKRVWEPLSADPWTEPTVRFVASPADGIADYVYDKESKRRFRGPLLRLLPVLLRYGDIAVLEGAGKLVRRSRVIGELERVLSEKRRELEALEKKLKKRRSSYLEELKAALESHIAEVTRALEYLTQ